MIVVRFKVKSQPDKSDQVRAAFEQVIAPSREIDGVVSFDIARDLSDPDSFIATEVFEDSEARERQEALPQVAETMAVLQQSLAAPPEATVFEVSAAVPASP